MAFNQLKLDRSVLQSRGIFNKYVYETDDTIEEVQATGYFSESRFKEIDNDSTNGKGWNGGIIECSCSDGFFIAKIDGDTGSVSDALPSGNEVVDKLDPYQVPMKSPDEEELVYAGATVNPTTGEWEFDKTIKVPSASVDVGDTITLSEGSNNLIIGDKVSGELGFVVQSKFDESGSQRPSYFNLREQYDNPLQPIDTDILTANPLEFGITGGAPTGEIRQTNEVTFRVASEMTNVTAIIVDDLSGVVLQYVPTKAAWEGKEEGLTFPVGDNIVDFIRVGDSGNPLVHYVGTSPFRIESGQQFTTTIKADNIALRGTNSGGGLPYLTQRIQEGPLVKVPTDEPLTNVIYVDKGAELPEQERKGSQSAPYQSIIEALDSITDNAEDNRYMVYVAPSEYVAPTVTLKPWVSIEGMGGPRDLVAIVGNIDTGGNGEYGLEKMKIVGDITIDLTAAGSSIVIISGVELNGDFLFDGSGAGDDKVRFTSVVFDGPVNVADVESQFELCFFNSSVFANGISGTPNVQGSVSSSAFVGCRFTTGDSIIVSGAPTAQVRSTFYSSNLPRPLTANGQNVRVRFDAVSLPDSINLQDGAIRELATKAEGTSYDPSESVLASTNVQDAIDELSDQFVKPIEVEELIEAFSTAQTQEPVSLDTPIQVEFGAPKTTPQIDMDAQGTFTIKEDGLYNFYFDLQAGRTGAAGVTNLYVRTLVDTDSVGPVAFVEIDDADTTWPIINHLPLQLTAGQTVKVEIYRDSTGVNTGGLRSGDPVLLGWDLAPTAYCNVSRLIGTAIGEAGSGNVTGGNQSIVNEIVRYSSTNGRLISDGSGITANLGALSRTALNSELVLSGNGTAGVLTQGKHRIFATNDGELEVSSNNPTITLSGASGVTQGTLDWNSTEQSHIALSRDGGQKLILRTDTSQLSNVEFEGGTLSNAFENDDLVLARNGQDGRVKIGEGAIQSNYGVADERDAATIWEVNSTSSNDSLVNISQDFTSIGYMGYSEANGVFGIYADVGGGLYINPNDQGRLAIGLAPVGSVPVGIGVDLNTLNLEAVRLPRLGNIAENNLTNNAGGLYYSTTLGKLVYMDGTDKIPLESGFNPRNAGFKTVNNSTSYNLSTGYTLPTYGNFTKAYGNSGWSVSDGNRIRWGGAGTFVGWMNIQMEFQNPTSSSLTYEVKVYTGGAATTPVWSTGVIAAGDRRNISFSQEISVGATGRLDLRLRCTSASQSLTIRQVRLHVLEDGSIS